MSALDTDRSGSLSRVIELVAGILGCVRRIPGQRQRTFVALAVEVGILAAGAVLIVSRSGARHPAHLELFLNPTLAGSQTEKDVSHLLSTVPAVSSFQARPEATQWQAFKQVIYGGPSLLPWFQPGCSSGLSVPELPPVYQVFLSHHSDSGP